MRVPKRIYELIDKRAKAADKFNEYDLELSFWLDEHGIETENYDIHGGVESIVNPWESARRIKQALERE